MSSSTTAILILAAGSSSRLGLPKQLFQLDHRSLLRRIAETALTLHPAEAIVVLGFESDRMKHELDNLPLQILVNTAWKEGIASSIRRGIESLPRTIDSALITLCDQPFVPTSHFRKLIAACSSEHLIAATAYGQSLGVPACFGRSIFPELLKLSGDSGAKGIIERHRSEVTGIPCQEAGIDIDTIEDQRSHLGSDR
jgi:molybdenum cofactor cytidylyltransferase